MMLTCRWAVLLSSLGSIVLTVMVTVWIVHRMLKG